MRNSFVLLDADLEALIRRLFRNPDSAFAVLGLGPASFGRNWQKAEVEITASLEQRVRMFELELRSQLHLLAQQVEEFENQEDLERLEAEGLSLLIALRELHRHFPELS